MSARNRVRGLLRETPDGDYSDLLDDAMAEAVLEAEEQLDQEIAQREREAARLKPHRERQATEFMAALNARFGGTP